MHIIRRFFIFSLAALSFNALAANDSPHAKKTLEIYSKVISIPTVAGRGKVPEMAEYLASQLKQAGFDNSSIDIIPHEDTAALVVTYKGDGSSGKKPIVLIGHMDVVEALPKDWQRPPFELTQDDTFFYGRGTEDNKLGVTLLTSTFIKLKQQGFVPSRDLIIAFSGDEETSMATTKILAKKFPHAEFVLNSDAGGGSLSPDGRALIYLVQAAEKTYASFELTVTNPGGHSSRPRPDNAIYELADALRNLQAYNFPVRTLPMTLDYFRVTGGEIGGELGDAMMAFAADPADKKAADRLSIESSFVGTTRTTCVPTLLAGGHAENALPQTATVTVNCRIFPGVKVSEVERQLKQVVANKNMAFKVLDNPIESPVSELRDDVMAAVAKAVHQRYPDVEIVGAMSTGATDGMHFRSAGLPTWAAASVFMNPDDNYAHGLNERLPIKAFYDGLNHWEIIIKALAGKP